MKPMEMAEALFGGEGGHRSALEALRGAGGRAGEERGAGSFRPRSSLRGWDLWPR